MEERKKKGDLKKRTDSEPLNSKQEEKDKEELAEYPSSTIPRTMVYGGLNRSNIVIGGPQMPRDIRYR